MLVKLHAGGAHAASDHRMAPPVLGSQHSEFPRCASTSLRLCLPTITTLFAQSLPHLLKAPPFSHCSSRMEDELFIFLRKQLAGAQASHRRVGIIGVVALVQRLGTGLSEGSEDAGAIGARACFSPEAGGCWGRIAGLGS